MSSIPGRRAGCAPRGNGIGSSNRRFHPRSADIIDGITQALHSELDVIGLKVAPALNLGEVAAFREPLKVFRGELSSGDAQSGEFLADERVSGHAPLKRSRGGQAIPRYGKENGPSRGRAEAVIFRGAGGARQSVM